MPDYPADPRTADAIALSGDLARLRLVNVARVRMNGMEVDLPRPAPGVAESATVAMAEAEANRVMSEITADPDWGGAVPYQPNEALVLKGRSLAGTVATSASVGLEAFANFQLHRALGDEPVWERRDPTRLALHERYADILPTVLEVSKPTAEPW